MNSSGAVSPATRTVASTAPVMRPPRRWAVWAAGFAVLAVNPQDFTGLFDELRDSTSLLVSIAAGVTIARMEQAMPLARVVRVMPNTPCLVGEMAAGYAFGARVSEAVEKDPKLAARVRKLEQQYDNELINPGAAGEGSREDEGDDLIDEDEFVDEEDEDEDEG